MLEWFIALFIVAFVGIYGGIHLIYALRFLIKRPHLTPVLYTVKKPQKLLKEHHYTLYLLSVVAIASPIVTVSLSSIGTLVFTDSLSAPLGLVLGMFIALNILASLADYFFGVMVHTCGPVKGFTYLPWDKIVHKRWLIKEKRTGEKRHFLVMRQRSTIVPLVIEVHVEQIDAIEALLERYVP